MPSGDSKIRADHNPWFKGYSGGTSNWLLDHPPMCFEWLFQERSKKKLDTEETAIDMGCGDGRKTLLLIKNGIKKVIGVDMVPEAIQMARELASHHDLDGKIEFINSKILDETRKISDSSIQIITDTYVFTHQIPDEEGDRVEDYVNEYFRILAPGGLLALELFSAEDEHFYGQKLEDISPVHLPEGAVAYKKYKYQFDSSKEEAKGAESYHDMHNVHYTPEGIEWILRGKFEILKVEPLPHSRHKHRKVLDVLARVIK